MHRDGSRHETKIVPRYRPFDRLRCTTRDKPPRDPSENPPGNMVRRGNPTPPASHSAANHRPPLKATGPPRNIGPEVIPRISTYANPFNPPRSAASAPSIMFSTIATVGPSSRHTSISGASGVSMKGLKLWKYKFFSGPEIFRVRTPSVASSESTAAALVSSAFSFR